VNHLKDLVVKANSSFSSSQKKSNQRFGLSNFVAASTDQMLMTRGGYGAVTTLLSSCIHASVGTCDRFPCNVDTFGGGGSAGALWGNTSYVDGQTNAQRLGFTTDQSALVNAFAQGAGYGLVSGLASSFMAMRSSNPYTALAGGFIGFLREYSSQFTEWENSIKGN
jgi:hypothetical protein